MHQILQNLQQTLLNEHIPNEQVQNIINSVDISQLNVQDLPATTEYITQFLGNMGLQENVISHINTSLVENFGNLGINNIADLGVDPDGIINNVKNIFGGFIGND